MKLTPSYVINGCKRITLRSRITRQTALLMWEIGHVFNRAFLVVRCIPWLHSYLACIILTYLNRCRSTTSSCETTILLERLGVALPSITSLFHSHTSLLCDLLQQCHGTYHCSLVWQYNVMTSGPWLCVESNVFSKACEVLRHWQCKS